ncbi:hypothetical protein CsSME_00041705 [Camellia sinensis var. sinensis]
MVRKSDMITINGDVRGRGRPNLICVHGTPVNIIVGSHVWVEDPDEAWIDGQIQTRNDKTEDFICCLVAAVGA